MKIRLFILCLLFLISNKINAQIDSNENQSNNSNKELALNGVWKMISYYNFKDNKVIDTIYTTELNKQIKMYTDSKVMWSRFRDSDTLDWFAFGNYKIGKGLLTEELEYGSKSMNKAIKDRNEFVFKLILDHDKFSQIQTDEEGNAIFAENYIRIE